MIAVPWNERVVEGDGGCLLWTGAVNSRGYGCIMRGARGYLAHRVAYEDTIGPIPAGHQIHHRCSTPLCVNPLHLEALSPRDHQRLDRTKLTAEQVRAIKQQPHVSRSAHAVLDQMLPGELYVLARAAESLAWRARNTADNKVIAEERAALAASDA